ncbi:MAG TPA: hypothetical protein V6D08_15740 [Candidatus Obscuribacterales bacterium]
MKIPLSGTGMAALFCAAVSGSFQPVAAADAGSEALQRSWWVQFQQKEQAPSGSVNASSSSSPGATQIPAAGTAASSNLSATAPELLGGAVQKTYFTVPAYFSSQPKPYERPGEVFQRPTFAASTAWRGGLFGAPYVPWVGTAFGRPWSGGWGWAGSYWPGSWGWGGLPFGAPWATPFGGRGRGGQLGALTAPAVWQTAPSKPSGNYYAPSTVDTSASGSYYATTTPAQTPLVAPQKPITNFWGSGSPFGKDTTMPWNR